MLRYLLISVFLFFYSFIVKGQIVDTLQGNTYLNKAKYFQDSVQYDSAVYYYQLAAIQFRDAQFFQRHLYATQKMVHLLEKQGELDEGIRLVEEIMQLGESQFGEESHELNELYLTMGMLYFHKRNATKARAYYQEYLDRNLPLYGSQHINIARVNSKIAVLDLQSGKLDKGLTTLKEILEIQLKTYGAKHSSVSKTYNNIGNVYYLKGQRKDARTFYEKALEIELELYGEEHINLAKRYNSLGLICKSEGRYEDALIYMQKSLYLNQKTYGEDHPEVPKIYDNMGLVYRNKGEYVKSLEFHLKALNLAMKLYDDDHPYLSKHYNNVGIANKKLERMEEALFYYEKALEIRLKKSGEGDQEVANILTNMGGLYKIINQVEKAFEFYEKSLTVNFQIFGSYHPHIANSHNNISALALEQKQYVKALDHAQKGILANIPFAENEQILDFSKALSPLQLIRSLNLKAAALGFGALAMGKQKDKLDLALDTYKTTIELVDKRRNSYSTERRQFNLGEKMETIYADAFELCWQANQLYPEANYLDLAFFFSEKTKSMVLLDAFRLSNAQQFAGVPDSLIKQEKELKTKLAYLHKKNQPLKNQKSLTAVSENQNAFLEASQVYHEFLSTLKDKHPRYYQMKYEIATASTQDVQEHFLNKKTALLEYFETAEKYWLFVITKDGKWVYPIEKNQNLEENLAKLLEQFEQKPAIQNTSTIYSSFENSAYQVYEKILYPALEKLDTSIHQLVIIPQGELGKLPFEALLTEKRETVSCTRRNANYLFSTLPYLNTKYMISYNYSATLALQMNQLKKEKKPPNVLAFAPFALKSGQGLLEDIHRNESFGPLPASIKEIKGISQYFSGYFYLREEATEIRFKEECGKSQFNLIHLSSHSVSSQEIDEETRIYFSDQKDEEEDNTLFGPEIYNLSIPAELIVLSACETGRGKYHKGEGLISLARAFSYAGCPSLVMTLWRVNDQSGANVMAYFYEELAKGYSKNTALQRARHFYLQEQAQGNTGKLGAHPYYWAAYVGLGRNSVFSLPAK